MKNVTEKRQDNEQHQAFNKAMYAFVFIITVFIYKHFSKHLPNIQVSWIMCLNTGSVKQVPMNTNGCANNCQFEPVQWGVEL